MLDRTESMNGTYQRKVSPVERLFIIASEMDPPFCNQVLLEGTGVLDESLWKNAVDAACEANPGSRLVFKGRSIWAKWVDTGVAAPIRCIDGSNWSGYESEGAPFLFEPLPYKTSHTSEVVLINGSPPRVVFRTHHATMDGGGTALWVLDIFRALRKEPLVGTPSTITDSELVAGLKLKTNELFDNKICLTPTGRPDGQEPGFIWKRTTLKGKFSKLLPQLALAVAKEARKHGPGHVRFSVPLDLRKRVPGTASTANLTRRIFLDIEPDATIDSIHQQMKEKLDNLVGDPRLGNLMSYLPLGWMQQMFITSKKNDQKKGIYKDTGTISNLGKLPVEQFRGGGFEAQTCFYIPPQVEAKPFFITLSGYKNFVEMITAMPKVLATNGRLEQFITNIVSELKTS